MAVKRSCPICRGETNVPVGFMPSPTHPMHIVACRGCGLVYVNPMFTNADKQALSPHVRLLHPRLHVGPG